VEYRDRKDGSIKKTEGQLRAGPAGFQVFTGEKFDKLNITLSPDDIVKVTIGDLQGVERGAINSLFAKEDKKTAKDYDEARTGYQDLLKKAGSGAPERTRRHLEFKIAAMTHRVVDDMDPGEKWEKQADEAIKVWSAFTGEYKTGWELWPATRSLSRLQVERGKFDDAARTWGRIAKNAEMPPEARLEAAIQEIDLQIRGKAYSNAAVAAAELIKTAAGARKDRLAIYQLAAKAGGDGKPLDGVEKIRAELAKTKDPSVQATAFSMCGELYLAGGKPRDAMWEFLWVETVVNQDRDEVFKAMARLTGIFVAQMDEDQTRKYRDKLKRFKATF
jgi:hypothetical protein